MKSFLYLFIVSLALLGSEVNAQSAKAKTVSNCYKKKVVLKMQTIIKFVISMNQVLVS
ncbi:hypothetical protein [Phocaeicola paurosaccharolyticus]|uniref:hypothetical protein n=1 Tax=Phocaeicola paurosaccharolyticus TaxID=732242 RepID=UPI000AC7F059|nr:hypothetical protein [Phocaeicola paurosaccharolyticus]